MEDYFFFRRSFCPLVKNHHVTPVSRDDVDEGPGRAIRRSARGEACKKTRRSWCPLMDGPAWLFVLVGFAVSMSILGPIAATMLRGIFKDAKYRAIDQGASTLQRVSDAIVDSRGGRVHDTHGASHPATQRG